MNYVLFAVFGCLVGAMFVMLTVLTCIRYQRARKAKHSTLPNAKRLVDEETLRLAQKHAYGNDVIDVSGSRTSILSIRPELASAHQRSNGNGPVHTSEA